MKKPTKREFVKWGTQHAEELIESFRQSKSLHDYIKEDVSYEYKPSDETEVKIKLTKLLLGDKQDGNDIK